MLAYHEHYTIKDYALWEGEWELIGGMPYAMAPSPNVSHQIVAGNILTQLNNSISNHSTDCKDCFALMEVDWEVSNDTVVKPDVLIICNKIDEKVVKTPAIIFEVSSPSTAKRDEQLKFELYEKEAVSYYILIYPETQVAKVYHWISGSYQKVNDFSIEIFEFIIGDCNVNLDFSSIWRR
jgi:Uma2 family endonuclease